MLRIGRLSLLALAVLVICSCIALGFGALRALSRLIKSLSDPMSGMRRSDVGVNICRVMVRFLMVSCICFSDRSSVLRVLRITMGWLIKWVSLSSLHQVKMS